ncbi:helix-turn-helix transcriptional regulator [Ancylobacter sp. SL191]|uniref:helix-turn-helix transcriptional regulator n=1 Tax=Ancylobacter sp. SL191 TaxID=2995166 RepID=UPI00226F0FC7|nr:AraC family transcriptional regulator [Ancylobacter sp. SL191]WAC29280.1 AraC family transcriptional regulator [Ancylobacter sp. SL191]
MMDEPRATTLPPEHGYADWLTAVAPALRALDWQRHMQVDDLGEGVSIALLDVLPPEDVELVVEGPPTFSISVFVEGEGTVSIDGGEPLVFTPGTTVICSTDRIVSGVDVLRGGVRLRIVDVRFEPQLLAALGGPLWRRYGGRLLVDRSVPEQGAVMVGFPAPPALLQVAQHISGCIYRRADVRRLYLRAKALEMLAIVMGLFLEADTSAAGRGERAQRKVEEAQRLIEGRLHEPWTITRLSREVGLNEKSLKSAFRAHVGQSIHAYLTQIRVEAAANMLSAGQTVTETALATGFTNLSHFSKTFRKVTGFAPSCLSRRR